MINTASNIRYLSMTSSTRKFIKKFIPNSILKLRQIFLNKKFDNRYEGRKIGEIFGEVYRDNLWGDGTPGYYSGPGSHDPSLVVPYVEAIKLFLQEEKMLESANDIGCGDFNIGHQISPMFDVYRGFDIVQNVIDQNRKLYPHLEFHVLDATSNKPPKAQVIFIREVLQHLSNIDVQRVLKHVQGQCDVLIVSNARSKNNLKYVANKDMPTGPIARRAEMNSGLNLEAEPFNLAYVRKVEICELDIPNSENCITTTAFIF